METSNEGGRTLARSVAHWQSVVLVGLSVAAGLTLTVMVIGSGPSLPAQARRPSKRLLLRSSRRRKQRRRSWPTPTTVPEVGVDVVEAPATDQEPAPLFQPRAMLPFRPRQSSERPRPPRLQPHRPRTCPRRSPGTRSSQAGTDTAPAAAPAPARASPAPTTAAPTTAAPTTAAPTTAAPTTSAAAVTLSYPNYSVSGVGSVGLQFDGSAIYVAYGVAAGQLGLRDRPERSPETSKSSSSTSSPNERANSMPPSKVAESRSIPEVTHG